MNIVFIVLLAGFVILAVACIVLIRQVNGYDEMVNLLIAEQIENLQTSAAAIKGLYGELMDRCYNLDDVIERLGLTNNLMIVLVKEYYATNEKRD